MENVKIVQKHMVHSVLNVINMNVNHVEMMIKNKMVHQKMQKIYIFIPLIQENIVYPILVLRMIIVSKKVIKQFVTIVLKIIPLVQMQFV